MLSWETYSEMHHIFINRKLYLQTKSFFIAVSFVSVLHFILKDLLKN